MCAKEEAKVTRYNVEITEPEKQVNWINELKEGDYAEITYNSHGNRGRIIRVHNINGDLWAIAVDNHSYGQWRLKSHDTESSRFDVRKLPKGTEIKIIV